MAKNKVLLTVFFALLVGFAVFFSCAGEGADGNHEGRKDDMNSNNNTGEGLSAKTKKQIVKYCFDNWGASGVTCYGTYNGWVVVRVVYPSAGVIRPDDGPFVTIGGFDISVNPPIIAWKDGQIHELKEAYDLGLLTQDDLISIVEPRPKENWWATTNNGEWWDLPPEDWWAITNNGK